MSNRTLFTLGREPPFPSIYSENKTPVTVDILLAGWIAAFLALVVARFAVLLGMRPLDGLITFLRIAVAWGIGLIIILCNFGQQWEVGYIQTKTSYKAGSSAEIKADIGIYFGLRAVNITLKSVGDLPTSLQNETINYNERFWWTWGQGRRGFGPFAGEIQQEFRQAQLRGLPYPILWLAEYFTFDGEGIRFGRLYRLSGWYAHICIWLAFAVWILTMILCTMVVAYGAKMMVLLGTLLVSAATIWALNRNFIDLVVPFENGVLDTHFGVHWYLALSAGIFCIAVGLDIYLMDFFYHGQLNVFFGINPLIDEDFENGEETPETSVNQTLDEIEMSTLPPPPPPPKALCARPTVILRRERGTKRIWRARENESNYLSMEALSPPPPIPTIIFQDEYLDMASSTAHLTPNQHSAMSSHAIDKYK